MEIPLRGMLFLRSAGAIVPPRAAPLWRSDSPCSWANRNELPLPTAGNNAEPENDKTITGAVAVAERATAVPRIVATGTAAYNAG